MKLYFLLVLVFLISTNLSFAQFGGGNGTQTAPYEIHTIEHLMALSDSVENSPANDVATDYNWSRGKYFILMNDITDSVRFTIGLIRNIYDYVNSFQGDFDGNNKQITLALNGKQKLIDGVWTNVWNWYIGLFSGIYLASVYDLSVNGYVRGEYYVAGICALTIRSSVLDCINRCDVESYGIPDPAQNNMGYISGICGCVEQSSISNCINYGNVNGYCRVIGGIVGWKNNVRVTDCINYGNIEGYLNYAHGGWYVGGICGFTSSDTSDVFLNCHNYGNVSGDTSVGGIAGQSAGVRNRISKNAFLNCHNYGNVSGEYCVGGMTGCMILYNDYAFQCSNSGTITGRISVGGIAGHTHTDATISNCINIGTVRGSISVGGIAAGFDNYGFGFYEDELSGSVNNCHNAGLVIGSDYVGGIQSYCWGGEITNSLNTGVVVGYSNTGSITGKITWATTVQNCHYDKQMCIYGGITGQDIAGQAEGYLTKELIGNNLENKLGNTDWTFDNANLYPTLKHFEKDSVAFVASSPVYLYDSDVADFDRQNRVSTDFKVNLENDVKWNRIIGNVDIVNDDGLLRNDGSDTLVCSIGNYKKLMPINIELSPNYNVNFTIWATEHKLVAPSRRNYRIPIYIKSNEDVPADVFAINKLVIEIDNRVFYPKRTNIGTLVGKNQNEITIENIKIPALNAGEEVMLFYLIGDMLLGTIDSSEIIINPNVEFAEELNTEPELKNGHITLNICHEGSDRFIGVADKSPSIIIKNNPVEDILEVECNVVESGKYLLEVVDITGRSVKVEEFVAGGAKENQFYFELTTNNLSAGNYLLVLNTPTGKHSAVFVVKR